MLSTGCAEHTKSKSTCLISIECLMSAESSANHSTCFSNVYIYLKILHACCAGTKMLTVNSEEKTRLGSKLLQHSVPLHLAMTNDKAHGYVTCTTGLHRLISLTICPSHNVNAPKPFIISVKTPGSLSIRHHSSAILLCSVVIVQ